MKRIAILVVFTLNSALCHSQINCDFLSTVRELKFSFGDEEPVGCVYANKGSCIIATNQTPNIGDEGLLVKIDRNFNTQWQLRFTGEIKWIQAFNDSIYIIVGETFDSIWAAHINNNGRVLWRRKYKVCSSPMVDAITGDTKGNTYIIINQYENKKIIPLQIRIGHGKIHMRFFNEAQGILKNYFVKISSNDSKIFNKRLFKKPIFDDHIFADSSNNIFVNFTYSNKFHNNEDKYGNVLYKYNSKGKIVYRSNEYPNLVVCDKGTLNCFFCRDTLHISKWGIKKQIPIDSIEVNGPFSKSGGYAISTPQIIKLKDKYLFICQASGRDLFCLLDTNLHFINYHFYEISGGFTQFINSVLTNEGNVIILDRDTYDLYSREQEYVTKTHLLELKIKEE